MQIDSLGEFGLIDQLVSRLGSRDDVVLGPGDDTAVVRTDDGTLLLLTADTLVEGVHFVREQLGPTDLGWKALAVSLSDIAAMGGTPRWATVSIRVPGDLEAEWCSMLYDGLNECAEQYDVAVVGGNVARSAAGDISVDSSVVGTLEGRRYVTRAGARPDDVILLTGTTGLVAAGRGCLDRGLATEPYAKHLLHAFIRPVPRLDAGRRAAAEPTVTAMIDVSDGLVADLGHICKSSGVAAEVYTAQVPIAPELSAYADVAGADPLALALAGGEDYELVVTCGPDGADDVAGRIGATVIGRVRAGEGVTVLDADGRPVTVDVSGWNHMRKQNTESRSQKPE